MPETSNASMIQLPERTEVESQTFPVRHVEVKLDTQQANKLARLYDALVDGNFRINTAAGPKPLRYVSDAMRWLIDQIPE